MCCFFTSDPICARFVTGAQYVNYTYFFKLTHLLYCIYLKSCFKTKYVVQTTTYCTQTGQIYLLLVCLQNNFKLLFVYPFSMSARTECHTHIHIHTWHSFITVNGKQNHAHTFDCNKSTRLEHTYINNSTLMNTHAPTTTKTTTTLYEYI